jgi:hypothetical protein
MSEDTHPDPPFSEQGRGRKPAPTAPLTWKAITRPNFTTTSLEPNLLAAIRATASSHRAIEMSCEGDAIGLRRVLQRLTALQKRKFFGQVKLRTARRGGSLYVWLQRERPPKTKATKAAPTDTVPCDSTAV